MIGVDSFASVFGGQPQHTAEHLTEHLRAVIRAGFSPVLCKPGTKEPVCVLSAAQAKKADREARERALAANPATRVDRLRHPCGMKHVLDDPAKVGAVVKRLVDVHGGLNVALHLGRSRMLVVDVDTPAERSAFRNDWYSQMGGELGGSEPPGITVESPGSFDVAKGEWVHWGGGHWWFRLPEEFVLPAGKVFKGPGGWAAMWGESYALVPPATRPEGAYRLVGGTNLAPTWLLDTVTEAGAARQQAAGERSSAAGGPIDAWSASTSWADLLAPRGWIETSMVEGSCGCPIWTAPGDHSSPKSATAHDLSCSRFDVSDGWGPLKIWTDHPPDGLPPEGAVTKLQFVSLVDHGGDDGSAIRSLGIEREQLPAGKAFDVPDGWERPTEEFGHPTVPSPGEEPELGEPLASWADVDLGPYLDGTYEAPRPTMLPRSDGVCLLYPGLTHSIHGESESGKSWIVQAECARLIRSGWAVLYVDFESDAGQLVHRLRLLGCSTDEIKRLFRYKHPDVAPSTVEEYDHWSAMFAGRYALAVIDGVTDAMGIWGKSTKDNDEYSAFAKAFPRRLARETGAAVVLIDHVTKDKDGRGRFALGGQAKMATLDGAAYVVDVVEFLSEGGRGVLTISIAKDRPGGVRKHGGRMNAHRLQPVAEFILDSTDGPVMVAVNPPPAPDDDESSDVRTAAVVDYIGRYPGQSQSVISRETGIRPPDVIPILRRLEMDGVLVIEKIGQKHAHTLIQNSYVTPSTTTTADVGGQNGQVNPPYVYEYGQNST